MRDTINLFTVPDHRLRGGLGTPLQLDRCACGSPTHSRTIVEPYGTVTPGRWAIVCTNSGTQVADTNHRGLIRKLDAMNTDTDR